MAARRRTMRVTAAVVMKAMEEAERGLEQPPAKRKTNVVPVRPEQVEFWTELFQPRKFSEAFRELDAGHVKDLGRRIVTKGELDPITVIKINGRWYCVDGHHRIAAYRQKKWKGTIKAEWFRGSLQEAMDFSVIRNEVAKLPMHSADKFEEAWRRVVMERGSKTDQVTISGASAGTVAKMRRVWSAYKQRTERGRRLREHLGDIRDCMWRPVQQAWDGFEPGTFDVEEAAGVLSRTISKRLTNLLRKNVEVTARALWLYDPHLCEPLANALVRVVREKANDDSAEEGLAHLRQAGHDF